MNLFKYVLILAFASFAAVTKMTMPTDYSSVSAGTRANLKANFDETQTKFNPAADSIDEVRGRMSGYTGEFTISSLDNLRLRIDTDGSSVARFYVANGYTSDSLFRVAEDSTWKFWGPGIATKLTLSDSILAAHARITGNGYFGGTLTTVGASTLAGLSATTGTFSSTLTANAAFNVGAGGSMTLGYMNASRIPYTGASSDLTTTSNLTYTPGTTTFATANGTFSGTLGVTGQSTFAGATISGGSSGQGRLYTTGTVGLALQASAGSSYDLSLLGTSGIGSYVMRVPTGTTTAEFPNAVSLSYLSSGRVPVASTGGLLTQDNLYWDATNDRLGIGSGASSPATDFEISKGTAGTATVGRIYNTDNTNGSSNAVLQVFSGGASGGDPFIRFNINGATDWSVGPDNSDADAFVITPSSSPGGATNGLRISTAGAVTVPGTLGVTGAVTASQITLGGGEAFVYGDTSFTLTATGMTTSPTGTAYATKIGNMVNILVPFITGTSNASTFTLTGIPAGWRPARTVAFQYHLCQDNGSAALNCNGRILSTGVIDLGNSTFPASIGGWTSSGTKAAGESGGTYTITYNLQ